MAYKKAGLSLWIVEWLSLEGTLRCRLVLHPACLWAGSPTTSKAPPCSVHQILEMKFPSGTTGTSHPWNIKPTPTKGLLTFQCLMVPHESAMHSTFRLMSPSAYSDFFFFFVTCAKYWCDQESFELYALREERWRNVKNQNLVLSYTLKEPPFCTSIIQKELLCSFLTPAQLQLKPLLFGNLFQTFTAAIQRFHLWGSSPTPPPPWSSSSPMLPEDGSLCQGMSQTALGGKWLLPALLFFWQEVCSEIFPVFLAEHSNLPRL